MDKNCGGDWINCEHSAQSGTGISCKFMGYCDFQLPRDSRNLKVNEGVSGICNYKGTLKCLDCGKELKPLVESLQYCSCINETSDQSYIEGKYKMCFACNKIKEII